MRLPISNLTYFILSKFIYRTIQTFLKLIMVK